VALLAPVVMVCAQEGDRVAQEIVRQAGQALGRTAGAVIEGIDMGQACFEMVLSGGLFERKNQLWHAVAQAMSAIAPHAAVIEPRHDPAYGAALLARQVSEGSRFFTDRGGKGE
jgi:N-acetylglucosamine kinase